MASLVTIRTVANPSFSDRVIAAINSETRHRTVTGSMRRLKSVSRDAIDWGKANGRWGHIEIEVNGEPADQENVWHAVEEDDLRMLARELRI